MHAPFHAITPQLRERERDDQRENPAAIHPCSVGRALLAELKAEINKK
jgi:hypothetical protein